MSIPADPDVWDGSDYVDEPACTNPAGRMSSYTDSDRTPPYGIPVEPQSTTSTVKDRVVARFHGATVEGWTPRIVLAFALLFAMAHWGLHRGVAAGLALTAVLYGVQLVKAQRVGRFWFARPLAGALAMLLLTVLVVAR